MRRFLLLVAVPLAIGLSGTTGSLSTVTRRLGAGVPRPVIHEPGDAG